MGAPGAANHQEIARRLAARRGDLAALKVASLALFGSAARGELGPESDVDILVTCAGPATFDGCMDLKLLLEEALGRPIDLVTEGALKPALRARIAPELIHVA